MANYGCEISWVKLSSVSFCPTDLCPTDIASHLRFKIEIDIFLISVIFFSLLINRTKG